MCVCDLDVPLKRKKRDPPARILHTTKVAKKTNMSDVDVDVDALLAPFGLWADMCATAELVRAFAAEPCAALPVVRAASDAGALRLVGEGSSRLVPGGLLRWSVSGWRAAAVRRALTGRRPPRSKGSLRDARTDCASAISAASTRCVCRTSRRCSSPTRAQPPSWQATPPRPAPPKHFDFADDRRARAT